VQHTDRKILHSQLEGTNAFPFTNLFLFAMIDDDHFGNGVGLNQKTKMWISLLRYHYFNYKHPPIVVLPEKLYFFSQPVTDFFPNS
jgi:hypothetical protein